MDNRNRIYNAGNPYQGDYKRVLCVCSAGLLRSPTAAIVLAKPPFNFNTRAAGLNPSFALICVDEVLLAWADEVVCMELDQKKQLQDLTDKPIVCLEISDSFSYRDKNLMKRIRDEYKKRGS